MILRIALSTLLFTSLSTLSAAQTICHAENDGPNFNDLVSMGGPNLLLGVRFTAPSSFTCNAIEVFTGEGTGMNSVAIWSHDAVNNEPDVQSGVGSWNMSATNSFQGASLGTPVALSSGQTYWMVWGCQNGSQAAVDVPMTFLGQVYRGSFDGGANWSGPFQFTDRHWKFRLYGDCGGGPITSACFGDGSGTACPCGNNGNAGTGGGCTNAAPMPAGQGAVLSASGSNSIAADDLVLTADFTTNQPGLFFQGQNSINGGNGDVFGDGLRCCGLNVVRLEIADPPGPNGTNTISTTAAILGTSPGGTTVAGDTRCYQWWYRNPGRSVCGSTFNLSNSVIVTWAP